MERNKTITPAQFVERWVPGTLQDWENMYRREIAGRGHTQEEKVFEKHRYIFAKFPEALAAFEAHIREETWREACEAQRVECLKQAIGYLVLPDTLAAERILNAPIPEIPKNEKI